MNGRRAAMTALSGVALLSLTTGCGVTPWGSTGDPDARPNQLKSATATPSEASTSPAPETSETEPAPPDPADAVAALAALTQTEGAAVDYDLFREAVTLATDAETNYAFQVQYFKAGVEIPTPKGVKPVHTLFGEVNDADTRNADIYMSRETAAGVENLRADVVDGGDTVYQDGPKSAPKTAPYGEEPALVKTYLNLVKDPLLDLPAALSGAEDLVYEGTYEEKGERWYHFDVTGTPAPADRVKNTRYLRTIHIDDKMRVRYFETSGNVEAVYFIDRFGKIKDVKAEGSGT